MREFFSRNAPLFVTILVLIIGFAISWGTLKTEMANLSDRVIIVTDELRGTKGDLRQTQNEVIEGRITRQEILTKLSYIEALLLEVREQVR